MKHTFLPVFIFLFSAVAFAQNLNLTLKSHFPYAGQTLSNIHGWVDTADGKEYALVGAQNGLSIVDVSNPSVPVEIIQIPGPSSSWREIKTVGNYAYVTTEDGNIGLQIVDLTNLPNTNLAVATWKPLIGVDSLETIHALHADNGKVYLYGSNVGNQGAIIADVTTNPMAPVYLGSYDPRYIHDGYVRNDTLYAGHIYDGECSVVDVKNPAAPNLLAIFQTPHRFTHNTWLSANSKICFTTDEKADTYLAAFDVSNLGNIFETDRIQTNPGSNSIVHNTHIIQKGAIDYAVTSWYTEGVTIVDCSRPNNLVQVGKYDTDTTSTGGFNGCWGVYPYLPSGTIVASDIDNGLFVFSPTYVRACYLEGTVKDCNTGNAVSGVNVSLQVVTPESNSYADITDYAGKYEVGIAAADTYLVVFSKPGYVSDIDTVVLSAGIVNVHDVLLCPLDLFTYTGTVYDSLTIQGIPNANVSIYDADSRWDVTADANGIVSIPNMYAGMYTITAGKWGYVTKCFSSQNVVSGGSFDIGLVPGIYDDFTWDFGWTSSGTATQGLWERGEPKGTFAGSTPINPDFDSGSDCGDNAYVTGNTGTTASDNDVDGGDAILTSPVFDLSGYENPSIYYSRWYVLRNGITDSVWVTLSNGTNTVILEALDMSGLGQSQWVNQSFKVSSLLTPTANMKLVMRVIDADINNNVEAGLDHFYVLDSTGVGVDELVHQADVIAYPNPFSTSVTIEVKNSNYKNLEMKLMDVYGKEVKRLSTKTSVFKLLRGALPTGIYFYQITTNNLIIATGKLCAD